MRNNLYNRLCALAALAAATPLAAAAASSPTGSMPAPVELASGWRLQDASKITQSAAELSRGEYRDSAWPRATVPGTVLTSLVNDGVYPEPLYGENNRPDRIPESLCRTSYWYRTQFRTPAEYAGRQIDLNFDGINYAAEVWLNGRDLGSIKGAFARGNFDITNIVDRAGVNTLALLIEPPAHPGNPHEHTLANGIGGNGGALAADGPTFLCSVGWDWIPGIRDRDMGIWQRVTLSAHGPVTVRDGYVTSDIPLPRLDSADLTVQATLTNTTDQPARGDLVGVFDGGSFITPVSLAPREQRCVAITPAGAPDLHVKNPKLWWPNGYGAPNLYTMHLSFVRDGVVSDAENVSFGIRKIAYSAPGSDNLAISVNGVRVFCKGGDWGMDEAMKREPFKRLDAQIRMHRDANLDIIRNWVGQSTSEDFYDLCDKYGILVWDEFFQPNPGDGPNPVDDAVYLANVQDKILRFRSHPCILLWCGRNEGMPPAAILSSETAMLAQLDPIRLFQPSSASGRGVRSSGPYRWREPRQFYQFNEAFKTETGSVSVPTLESIEAMLSPKDLGVIDDAWAEHDLTRGAQAGDRYPHVIAQRYGAFTSLADFARKCQLADYEAFRAMFEGRTAHLFAPETGVITWMSNPAQPSFVWQLYAWDLEPNASLFAVRKACEPVHIQLDQDDWQVKVINNTPETLKHLTARVSVYNLDGSLVYARSDALDAPADAATGDGPVAFPANLSAVHFVKLALTDDHGRLLSDNFYWRETKQDDFQALSSLPGALISATVKQAGSGDTVRLIVMLSNPSRVPALMAHLQLRDRRTGKRVLPVFYSDNYLSLLPGEKKTVQIEAAAADLGKDSPQVDVDGWNVLVKDSGLIALNKDAAVIGKPAVTPAAASSAAGGVIRVNCGGESTSRVVFGGPPDSGSFDADREFDGGTPSTNNASIDTSASGAASADVYRSERYGEFTYSIPARPGQTYRVKLHFAEVKYDKPGARQFNVLINGQKVLDSYDIYADAGAKNRAVVKQFDIVQPATAARIVIAFQKGSIDNPKVCGIEVVPIGVRENARAQ